MRTSSHPCQFWPHQIELLSATAKSLIVILLAGISINWLWLRWDPLWVVLTQNVGGLLAALVCWWCLRLIRRGQVQWASRIFLMAGYIARRSRKGLIQKVVKNPPQE